ncbi:MAG TPA: hypothetical protein VK790_10210 [Solirubrobacteraceae bacterium]|jgi:hypothetical protein|nr:hypothetical protein [Solirubrobacteraceae bacterium]
MGLGVIFAISGLPGIAIACEGASEENEFVARNTYPVKIEGTRSESQKILEDGEDTVTCKKTEATGELKESSATLTVDPIYSECKAVIAKAESAATVSTGTCRLEYKVVEETEEAVKGTVSIGPKTCGAITISTSTCHFELTSQGPYTTAFSESKSEELEAAAEEQEAKVESNCAGTKAHPAAWLLVRIGHLVIVEVVGAHFTFTPATVTIARNTGTKVKIEDRTLLGMLYVSDELTGGWTVNKNGCTGFYFPFVTTCEVEVKAPNAATNNQSYKVKGVVLPRGSVTLSST